MKGEGGHTGRNSRRTVVATLRRDSKGTVVPPFWEIQGPEQQLQSSENLQLQPSFRPTNAKVAYLERRVLLPPGTQSQHHCPQQPS